MSVIEDVPFDEEHQSNTEISDQNMHTEEIPSVIGLKRKSAESYSSTGAGKRRKDMNAVLMQVFQKICE
ncbi:hypothetical protein NQ314_010152 [Rhamnusium bicolor]|uniref:Uncharacterized protein n=1 Tax=Rhamnusium bicolor TaxID=1586634 RepID=A0AAV8XUT2_9CUCU|nr:hypothetical protein NQ314_010152 [Rhamnusium bicolor]